MNPHPSQCCILRLLAECLKPASAGVEQHYIIIVNQTKDIVVSRQFHLSNAVGGHRQAVAVSSFESHKTIPVKAVQTVVRSNPNHTRTVLHRARGVPMAQAVGVIIKTQRKILGITTAECGE